MKRFLTLGVVLFIAIAMITSFIAKRDKYLQPIKPVGYVEGKSIVVNDKKMDIIGMNVSSDLPGTKEGETSISKDKYKSWFKQMQDLGINCVKVNKLMPNSFYEAIYDYNDDNKNPLYIMQGISITRDDLKDMLSDNEIELRGSIKKRIKMLVNCIHGNYTPFLNVSEDKVYDDDVSDYVIGYCIINDLGYDDFIYSGVMSEKNDFNGSYVKTKDGSRSGEVAIAMVGNELLKIDSEKYRCQRMISVTASIDDVLKNYLNKNKTKIQNGDHQDKKKRFIDPEYLAAGSKNRAGVFATYNIATVGSEWTSHDKLEESLKILNEYHTMPIVIGEYGIPTGRVVNDYIVKKDKAYISEQEQGKMLIDEDKAIRESGCAGGFIHEWQDNWGALTFNTKENADAGGEYWKNVISMNQNFGLLSFDKLINGSVAGPDDVITEWNEDNVIAHNDEVRLYMRQDSMYLHMMIRLDREINKKDHFYINIDVNKDLGSKVYDSKNGKLKFKDPSEFIIDIDNNKGELLVQDYYDYFTFTKALPELKSNPNEVEIKKDSSKFIVPKIKLKDRYFSEDTQKFVKEKDYEYGKLVKGSIEDNSQADYYIGEDYVEIRIPWQMLNFRDPSRKLICGDFYKELNVVGVPMDKIKAGVHLVDSDNKQVIVNDGEYKMRTWNKPDVKEIKKPAFKELKKYFEKLREE